MSNLPPGYRFYPTEEELICFYLRNKLENTRDYIERVIPVVDVCSVDPWQLSEMHGAVCAGQGEPWFFFCPRQEREARGGRPSRTTPMGYWKAAGTPSVVYSAAHRPIGMKKTMVFYRGRAPSGAKTHWKMNEYRAFQEDAGCSTTAQPSSSSTTSTPPQLRSEFSLCRLYTKSGSLGLFDRRPCTIDAGTSENPRVTNVALGNDESNLQRKRKRSGSNDGSSSDDDGSRGSLPRRGPDDLCMDEMANNWDFLDWA